jgi:hypothetical protein
MTRCYGWPVLTTACRVFAALLIGACTSDRAPAGKDTAVGGNSGVAGGPSGTGGAGGSNANSGGGAAGTLMSGGSGGAGNATGPDGGGGALGTDAGPGGTSVVAAGVRWVGRVDTTNVNQPKFAWSGTGFVAEVSGTAVSVKLDNGNAFFFQVIVDGNKGARLQATQGQQIYQVANGLANGAHTIEVYRETEGAYGTSQFLGVTEGTLMAPPPSPGRLIEFVGDSITAGYGNLGNEPHPNYTDPTPCTFSLDTESAYMSYGLVAARALKADASVLAMSGWGVYRDRLNGMTQVLPKVYSNTLGLAALPTWDFSIKPNAVVINLGTNDFAKGDPGSMFPAALGAFVDTIRTKYPSAWIFAVVGSMLGTTEHDQAKAYIQSVVSSHNGDAGKVSFVDLGIQDALKGTGCDWHPSTAEDQRMADVLVPVMKQKLGW